jgi:hypothetical protein
VVSFLYLLDKNYGQEKSGKFFSPGHCFSDIYPSFLVEVTLML